MITERQSMTDQAVHQLATNTISKMDDFVTDDNTSNDEGQIQHENCASVADHCSDVFHTYLTEQGFDGEHFQQGTVGRILGEVQRMQDETATTLK